MAFVVADRVQETTTTTGTGTVTLAGAVTGFQSFAAIGDGNNTFYTIADQSGSNWEVGIGTYTSSGTTLSRDTVLSSSNSGSLVNFSAGTKNVFVTQPSSRSAYAATVPSNGQLLIGNGSGFSLATLSAGSGISVSNSSGGITITNTGGSPGGSNTQIQYNNAGAFAGASGLVTDGTNLTINAQGDLRFADSDSSNWVAFQAPATVPSNVTWTLPSADGTSSQVISTNGSGALGWSSIVNGTISSNFQPFAIIQSGLIKSMGAYAWGNVDGSATFSNEIYIQCNETSRAVLVLEQFGANPGPLSIRPSLSQNGVLNITMPPNAGSSGQVLTTDGTGVTSWTTAGGGGGGGSPNLDGGLPDSSYLAIDPIDGGTP